MKSANTTELATPAIAALWTAAAARLGFRVERTDAAYASTDGRGTLLIGADDSLDHDDSLAQLIFHELCHAAVQGPSSWRLPDWGLSNVDDRHVWREHACLRLQAHLAGQVGLRALMQPTTDYRAYYLSLAPDVLGSDHGTSGPDDPAALARKTLTWLRDSSWREPLEQALAATAGILRAEHSHALDDRGTSLHPLGFRLGGEGERCGTCAWSESLQGSTQRACRQVLGLPHQPKKVAAETPACVRWESTLDCQACGACCREAYHSVSVSVRDPVVWKQPQLIERYGPRFQILREGDRCAALQPGREGEPRWTCSIYDDRPRTCRDFTAGSRHCLEARRRVGLSA